MGAYCTVEDTNKPPELVEEEAPLLSKEALIGGRYDHQATKRAFHTLNYILARKE